MDRKYRVQTLLTFGTPTQSNQKQSHAARSYEGLGSIQKHPSRMGGTKWLLGSTMEATRTKLSQETDKKANNRPNKNSNNVSREKPDESNPNKAQWFSVVLFCFFLETEGDWRCMFFTERPASLSFANTKHQITSRYNYSLATRIGWCSDGLTHIG